mgnify:CR=1 FL=1
MGSPFTSVSNRGPAAITRAAPGRLRRCDGQLARNRRQRRNVARQRNRHTARLGHGNGSHGVALVKDPFDHDRVGLGFI